MMQLLILTNVDVVRYGIAEVIAGLTSTLPSLGVSVHVYARDPTAQGGKLGNGWPCRYGPFPKPGSWFSRLALRPLAAYCRETGAQIVQTMGFYRTGNAARLLKRHLGIPYVLTSQGDIAGTEARLQRPNVQRRCRDACRHADAVTHLNSYMVAKARAIADVSDRYIIPNGVSVNWWRQPCQPIAGSFVLGIGRLVEGKGFRVLVAAAAAARNRGKPFRLVVAGGGVDADHLLRLTHSLGLPLAKRIEELPSSPPDAVCFCGVADGEFKRSLFQGAALVAFPTQPEMSETFGIVMVEAMAAGKALVGSDIPVVRELLRPGVNADLVSPRDPEAWADAITALLASPQRRQHYGEINLLAAEPYDWMNVARRYLQVYEDVLGHGENASPAA